MPNACPIDLLRRIAVPLLALLLGGCSTIDYYAHLGATADRHAVEQKTFECAFRVGINLVHHCTN